MPSIRIAAAQSTSVPCDIAANVLRHTKFIIAARLACVDLLVFPELSLTGYELPRLRECLIHPNDDYLAPIRDMAHKARMTVVVGAPIGVDSIGLPLIGAITFFPNRTHAVYCKQYLHAGEEQYVAPGGEAENIHALLDQSFAVAICADTTHPKHAESAVAAGASLYLAGVLVSDAGYPTDSANLHRYASTLNVGVLMSNHGGPSGGYVSAGKSAFWAPNGELVIAASGTGNFLVIASNDAGTWSGKILSVET